MRQLGLILGALGVIFVLATVVAWFLPAKTTVERSLAMQAPVSTIYAYLSDPRQFEEWSPWHQRDPMIETRYEGEEEGVGAIIRWTSAREYDGVIEITSAEQGAFVIYDIQLIDYLEGTGRVEIEPEESRYRVSWSVEIDFGDNIYARYRSFFVDDVLGKDLLSGLTHLKVRVESDRSPFPD